MWMGICSKKLLQQHRRDTPTCVSNLVSNAMLTAASTMSITTIHGLGKSRAVAGVFSISFMQRFATDVYLDTFLDELHQQVLTYEITDRHPLQIAPIADYRNAKQK